MLRRKVAKNGMSFEAWCKLCDVFGFELARVYAAQIRDQVRAGRAHRAPVESVILLFEVKHQQLSGSNLVDAGGYELRQQLREMGALPAGSRF